jgi:hypothetical protein
MNGFDIVMVFAIILFARLGVRLVSKHISMKKEGEDEDEDKDKDEDEEREN